MAFGSFRTPEPRFSPSAVSYCPVQHAVGSTAMAPLRRAPLMVFGSWVSANVVVANPIAGADGVAARQKKACQQVRRGEESLHVLGKP